MAYEKTIWKARQGTGKNKFTESERSGNTVVLHNTPDIISEPGTPFSVENMNHIEEGIFDAHEGVAAEAQKRADGDNALAAADEALSERINALAPEGMENLPGILSGINSKLTFSFVVDSDDALAAWATGAVGNDYSRVLIKAGTWTYNDPAATTGGSLASPRYAISLSARRTLAVVGEAGSNIVINRTASATTYYAGIFGRGNNSLSGYFMENVNLIVNFNCTSGSGYAVGFAAFSNVHRCTAIFSSGTVESFVSFYNCRSLTNCEGSGSGSGDSFSYCDHLTRCTSTSSYNGYSNCNYLTACSGSCRATTTAKIFYKCNYLTNCEGDTQNNNSVVFDTCTYLVACKGSCDSYKLSAVTGLSLVCYKSCKHLYGCIGDVKTRGGDKLISSTSTAIVFDSCSDLVNCRGTADAVAPSGSVGSGFSAKAVGYNGCERLLNCYGSASASTDSQYGTAYGYGFTQCKFLTSCPGYGSVTASNNSSGVKYSFDNCRTGFGCYGTGTFNSCYMEQNSGSTAWANTAAGGYNRS